LIAVWFLMRIVLVAAGCALGTMWLGWMSLPIAGFIYGMADRRARAHGTIAALGAVIAWIAILGTETVRGANVRAVADRMGEVMHVSAVTFALMTLVFAALLCGSAAAFGAAIRRVAVEAAGRGNGFPLSRE
jgi:hypothetical protein